MSNHRNYVLGLAFSENGGELLVIKKAKPEWQTGKFNGIGGKVEPFEKFPDAMAREFHEETNLSTEPEAWNYLGVMRGTDYSGVDTFAVYVFTVFGDFIRFAESPEVEPVQVIPVAELDRYPHIPNLNWLVPMALNKRAEGFQLTRLSTFEASYA